MSSLEVFILTYNRAGYLKESIESVLNSIFRDFTLTVVDNCSTDNTEEVVRSFDDPRLKYVKHPENIGGINNINSAIKMSTGDYIVLFHDDDLMKPEMLGTEYDYLEKHPEAGCVSCLTTNFTEDGRTEDMRATYDGEYMMYTGHGLFDAYFDKGPNTVCPSIMYRREMLHSNGFIFDPKVGPCCDIKLLFDIERSGCGVLSLNKCLMLTRRHEAQDSTMNYFPMHIELYDYLNKDPYYGPMLSEKKEWKLDKYADFSRALSSLLIKGTGDNGKIRTCEKTLRRVCGGRVKDRLIYDAVSAGVRLCPGVMKKVYYSRKKGESA